MGHMEDINCYNICILVLILILNESIGKLVQPQHNLNSFKFKFNKIQWLKPLYAIDLK